MYKVPFENVGGMYPSYLDGKFEVIRKERQAELPRTDDFSGDPEDIYTLYAGDLSFLFVTTVISFDKMKLYILYGGLYGKT